MSKLFMPGVPAYFCDIRRSPETRHVSFECPYCKDRRGRPVRHSHGWPWTDDAIEPGHRVAHCDSEEGMRAHAGGYILVTDEPKHARIMDGLVKIALLEGWWDDEPAGRRRR